MTRTGAVLVGLLVARCAAAAVWTCDHRVEMFTGQAYLVTARCTATGTYTSGGDPFGNAGMDLCNSAHRHPVAVLPTLAGNVPLVMGFLAAWDPGTGNIVLATASGSPGAGNPLVQVASIPIDGTTMRTLAICQ